MSARFYRVHYKDNTAYGMYQSWVSNQMFELETRHPRPLDDSELEACAINMGLDPREWPSFGHYGFKSIEQFVSWVYKSDWHDRLTLEGFVISVWHVSDPEKSLITGSTQAIYADATAVNPVKSVPVNEYKTLLNNEPIRRAYHV